jgi:hypothetical protein
MNGVVNEDSPLIEFRLEAEGALLNYPYVERRNLVAKSDGFAELVGEIVQFVEPHSAGGVRARFSGAIEDACSIKVSVSKTINLIDEPATASSSAN